MCGSTDVRNLEISSFTGGVLIDILLIILDNDCYRREFPSMQLLLLLMAVTEDVSRSFLVRLYV